MKKYIALIALIAATGCGGANKDKWEITTTETTTEFEYDTETEKDTWITENEEETENLTEEETKAVKGESDKVETAENAAKAEGFEKSDAYASLKSLASNAGFDISYSGNTVTFKTYITDDTIDYINDKDANYYDKWNEHCGLYEEFCSEAIRAVKDNGYSSDINVAFEVVGRSDNQVYYRNENGTSIYDAYKHENQL